MPAQARRRGKFPKNSAAVEPSLEERDEGFWRAQQARLTKQIGQPCCSLSGMTSLLVSMPGDFAVVLHSELDCTNCFLHTQGPSGARFYCVQITQAQFTTGKTAAPLRRCLELIARHKAPQAIFVLGNCLIEMIHDDFESVTREMEKKTGIPIIPLRTSGLKAGSQAEMIDWLYSTLAGLGKKTKHRAANTSPEGGEHGGPPDLTPRVNLIGMPALNHAEARQELESLLGAAGIVINGTYPLETAFADWKRIGGADANFVVDRTLYPKLLKHLDSIGLPSVEVPLPVGLGPTVRFLGAIGVHFGVQDRMRQAAAKSVARVRTRIEAFRSRFGGLRAAVGLRMVNNYRADQLAYDGLGDLAVFVETGFDCTLFIQGPPEEKARLHFSERLKSLGCDRPFHIFPDPFDLPPLLRAGRFDVAYLADHARGEARQAGVPLIQSRSLEPIFEGALRNIDYLERVLTDIRREPAHRS